MRSLLSLLAFTLCLTAVARADVLRTAKEVNDFLEQGLGKADFTLSVQAISDIDRKLFFAEDRSGRIALAPAPGLGDIRKGDLLDVKGVVSINPNGEIWIEATSAVHRGRSRAPEPVELTLSDLNRPENAYRAVRVAGTVFTITPDEFDDNFVIAILCDGQSTLPIILTSEDLARCGLRSGATARITGRYWRSLNGIRKFSGPCVIHDTGSPIDILSPPPENPFDAPPLERRFYRTPDEIARLGARTVTGQVIARWGNGRLMVKENDGRIINVTMADGEPAPALNETGVFVGYPYSDLMSLHLANARFNTSEMSAFAPDLPETVTPGKLIADKWFLVENDIAITYNGRLLRLVGTVRSLPSEQSPDARLYLDCDDHLVSVDISSCREEARAIPIGSRIEVTGRCLLETENGRADNSFPHVRDFSIITRSADDIKIVRLPPWWTPHRLLIVIGVTFAALLVSFVWVFALHRLAERRGQALYRARQAQEEERHTREIAELRMQDRTRLAVELHDTISQNLTGATMQIGTAVHLLESDHDQSVRHLDIATRTLDSCREELRNCIWDLRNNALDEPDLNAAILMALRRLTGDTRLQIRFNIPRSELSDNTVHALMCIVRELATNAVRHGHAAAIRIAGWLSDGILRFSVTDNGSGFDPEHRPGLAEGHFGLQGVEERIDELGGEMKITSKPGKGTRITVWIRSEC